MPVSTSGTCPWVGRGGWETALWATTPTAPLVWGTAVCHLSKPSWGCELVCGSVLGGRSLPPLEARKQAAPVQAPASAKGRRVALHPWGQEGFRQGWMATVPPESVPGPGLAGGRKGGLRGQSCWVLPAAQPGRGSISEGS